ncbi:hypothetical protein CHARACLAT_000550, partial [Characodon lateralis]|nr:hypothetical protein [Characodon lateralis]
MLFYIFLKYTAQKNKGNYLWRAHGGPCGPPKKGHPTPLLTHCQTGHTEGCCRQQIALPRSPHLWTSEPHTILMESVSNRLCRHMHIGGLLEVILQGSGSAPPAPPCTKAEVAVLLLGCCPPTASSTSPGVLACLL